MIELPSLCIHCGERLIDHVARIDYDERTVFECYYLGPRFEKK